MCRPIWSSRISIPNAWKAHSSCRFHLRLRRTPFSRRCSVWRTGSWRTLRPTRLPAGFRRRATRVSWRWREFPATRNTATRCSRWAGRTTGNSARSFTTRTTIASGRPGRNFIFSTAKTRWLRRCAKNLTPFLPNRPRCRASNSPGHRAGHVKTGRGATRCSWDRRRGCAFTRRRMIPATLILR